MGKCEEILTDEEKQTLRKKSIKSKKGVSIIKDGRIVDYQYFPGPQRDVKF